MKARRILCLLCILSMFFSLCSCSVPNDSKIQSITSAKAQITTTESGTAATEHTTDKSESTTSSTLTSTTASAKSSGSKATSKKAVTKKRTKKSVKSTTATITTTAVTQYCTVTIECKSVLDNMSSLKSGHSEYVPENGYILQNYKCPCQSDLTAYDLLKQSCDENGIKLTASKSGYGIYVKGINNLDEFDCGNESGWLYYVNGKKPPVSCDKYTVSPGDEIVFSYTCDY